LVFKPIPIHSFHFQVLEEALGHRIIESSWRGDSYFAS
jgi:hypothetical protein